MVWHGRALHDYLIPRHGKYSRKHNQYDIRAAHDVIPTNLQRFSSILIGRILYGMVRKQKHTTYLGDLLLMKASTVVADL